MSLQSHIDAIVGTPLAPPSAVIGILGMRKSGKTFLATRLKLPSDLKRIYYLDVVGAFSAYAKHFASQEEEFAKKDYMILHLKDMPDKITFIRAINAVKEKHIIIDLSVLQGSDLSLVVEWFCEYVMYLKQPCAVIADEVAEFINQNRINYSNRFESLVRIGRNFGVRYVIMISQRPQTINKNVFTQAELLAVFKLVHNLDLDAVRLILGMSNYEFADIAAKLKGLQVGEYLLVKDGLQFEWNLLSNGAAVEVKDEPKKRKGIKGLSEEEKADIIKHYSQGRKASEIQQLMGVSKATIYAVLREFGAKLKKPEIQERMRNAARKAHEKRKMKR
jgi:AraC-like DNA-binding protein